MRVQSDRVPDARPQSSALVPVVVLVPVFVLVAVLVAMAGLLVPHAHRMTRKTPCRTSTPAIATLLQKPRRPGPAADNDPRRL
jgi:cell division protein FtsN